MSQEQKIKMLISAYVDGETNIQETKEVESLLQANKEFEQYYQELKKMSASLLRWSDEDLSPDFKNNLLDKKNKPSRSLRTAAWAGGVTVTLIMLIVVGQMVSLNPHPITEISSEFVSQKENQTAFVAGAPSSNSLKKARGTPEYRQRKSINFKDSSPQFAASKIGEVGMLSGASTPMAAREQVAMQKTAYLGSTVQYEPYYLTTSYNASENTPYYPASQPPVDYKGRLIFVDQTQSSNTEEYSRQNENPFMDVEQNPLSTFSIDVDTASYSNIRRFLNNGQQPPIDSVRIEEMLNYFSYNYPLPQDRHPFSITLWGGVCPWNENHKLIQIGLKGKTLNHNEISPSNLVFLIDVSGSMNDPAKLPLLKTAFNYLTQQLTNKEKVAIVVYAGAAGVVLNSTNGNNKQAIYNAITNLQAGGSTAGGQGIELAYQIAQENFIPGGNNRVILATDGDFNVGVSSTGELTRLIEEKREKGIFLTVVGFGMGNYKDSRLEQIADKGNGNYYYIDNESEAKKVFADELGSTLFTIAKDVKLQLEFNPSEVKAYRLIGYENRMLAKEDFNDDKKDAGELGAGHTVTAIYEIIPAGSSETVSSLDPLKYQAHAPYSTDEVLTVKLRYKNPNAFLSELLQKSIKTSELRNSMNTDFGFALAVAEFGLLLKQSEHRANASFERALERARTYKGQDPYGYKQELIELIEKARYLYPQEAVPFDEGQIKFKNVE